MCDRECNGKHSSCQVTDKACMKEIGQCVRECERYSGYRHQLPETQR
jgi:hypothetical protein